MNSNEEHEELTADDIAWANMSYSERLVWWVNNKVLTKPDQTTIKEPTQSQETQDTTTEKPVEEQTKEEIKQETNQEVTQEVKQEEVQYEEPKQDAVESPTKKRGGKGKKISITLDA